MFDRFVFASNINRIKARFNMAHLSEGVSYEPNFNISTGGQSYVITDAVKKEIHQFQYGLKVQKRNQVQCLPLVRAEGDRNISDSPDYKGSKAIFLKPEFKQLIRQQRCLVLADAFVVGIETGKPYLVYLRNKKGPFAFAGIWNKHIHTETGAEDNFFAIITVPANKLLQQLGYKRMPVILHQQQEQRWLRSTTELWQVLELLNTYPANLMNAFPISTKIADSAINDISLVQPTGTKIYYEPDYHLSRKRKGEVRESIGITMAERAGIEVKFE